MNPTDTLVDIEAMLEQEHREARRHNADAAMTDGYLRWLRHLRWPRLAATALALALLFVTTTAFVPAPPQVIVRGTHAHQPDVACRQAQQLIALI